MKKNYLHKKDSRFTSSKSGKRILKCERLVELYGSFDELNAFLGFASEFIHKHTSEELHSQICTIQKELFLLASYLDSQPKDSNIQGMVFRLEQEISAMNYQLPELKHFVLTPEGEGAARLNLARVVCRRVERVLVGASDEIGFDKAILSYFNRLSDWIFVASLVCAIPVKA